MIDQIESHVRDGADTGLSFSLADEQKALRELAHELAAKEIRPKAAEYDEHSTHPADIIAKAYQLGPDQPARSFHTGCAPGNRGRRYSADPSPVEEIIAVMRAAGTGAHGDRLRGMIVVLWRAGLRVSEALALAETDLDPGQGAITIRRGKGGKRREVGMDQFGWDHLDSWLERRRTLPVGALFCILHSPTRGRP